MHSGNTNSAILFPPHWIYPFKSFELVLYLELKIINFKKKRQLCALTLSSKVSAILPGSGSKVAFESCVANTVLCNMFQNME